MVEVFREVRRVLAAHGTVWLNLGDSYTTIGRSARKESPGVGAVQEMNRVEREVVWAQRDDGDPLAHFRWSLPGGQKPKDLVGIPWRVAFALQADGWYLRSDIIWSKPNPMPESVTDRPTKAHEYVFLLSKQPRYFFDQEAVREAHSPTSHGSPRVNPGTKADAGGSTTNGHGATSLGYYRPPSVVPQDETLDGSEGEAPRGPDGRRNTHVQAADGSIQHRDGERWPNGGRNIRSVWEIPTQPYPEAHFATFPEELARRCIAAGCPENGIVLDPFIGSGTVAHVARKLGRHAVGIDLSEDYLKLAARRLQQQSLFADAT